MCGLAFDNQKIYFFKKISCKKNKVFILSTNQARTYDKLFYVGESQGWLERNSRLGEE